LTERAENQGPQGQVRAPFQKNYTEGQDEDEEDIVEVNHFFQEDELRTFLTEEDQFFEDSLIPRDQKFVLASDYLWVVKTEEYQRGYQNTHSHIQKQWNLWNINVPITLTQKRQNVQIKG